MRPATARASCLLALLGVLLLAALCAAQPGAARKPPSKAHKKPAGGSYNRAPDHGYYGKYYGYGYGHQHKSKPDPPNPQPRVAGVDTFDVAACSLNNPTIDADDPLNPGTIIRETVTVSGWIALACNSIGPGLRPGDRNGGGGRYYDDDRYYDSYDSGYDDEDEYYDRDDYGRHGGYNHTRRYPRREYDDGYRRGHHGRRLQQAVVVDAGSCYLSGNLDTMQNDPPGPYAASVMLTCTFNPEAAKCYPNLLNINDVNEPTAFTAQGRIQVDNNGADVDLVVGPLFPVTAFYNGLAQVQGSLIAQNSLPLTRYNTGLVTMLHLKNCKTQQFPLEQTLPATNGGEGKVVVAFTI